MKTLIPFKVKHNKYFQISHTFSIKLQGVLPVQFLPAVSAEVYTISCFKCHAIITNLFAGEFQPIFWFNDNNSGFKYQSGNQKQLTNS